MTALNSSSSNIDLDNATPSQLLLLAATLGRTDLVMSAINSGADVNALIVDPSNSNVKQTPLHAALKNRHIDVCRVLLSMSADLHLLDSEHRTALSYLSNTPEDAQLVAVFASDLCQKAARGDHIALSHAISAGVDPSMVDSPDLENTPLHWAASFGAVSCVNVLLAAKVPINPINKAGQTPLMDAAKAGHSAVVRLLVDAGADTSICDAHGKSLIDMDLSKQVVAQLKLTNDHDVVPLDFAQPAPSAAISNAAATQLTVHPTDPFSDSPRIPHNPRTPSFLPGGANTSITTNLPKWASALWPPPRRFSEAGDSFTVPPVLTVSAENSCLNVSRLLLQWLSDCAPLKEADTSFRLVGGGQGGLGEPIAFSAAIFLRIDPNALEATHEAYSICVRDFGVDVVGSDPHGLFYGCATLVNLFQLAMDRSDDPAAPVSIPTLSITDWPTIRRRALYLDVSSRRVPTVETLKRVIAFMARHLKMNQLHLNITENFDRLKEISKEGMFRHEDVLELDQWCKQHFVDLIPVIGQSVDEEEATQDGNDTAASTNEGTAIGYHEEQPVFSNGSTRDVKDSEMLFDEFLPLFNSEQVNLGNLTTQRSAGVLDYAHLRTLLRSLRSRGKKSLLMFGEQLLHVLSDSKRVTSTLPELPARLITILEVGNEKSLQIFNQDAMLMRRHGIPFYTSSSSCLDQTITGRLSQSLRETDRAVSTAVTQGGVGVVLKDTSLTKSHAPLVFLLQNMIPFGGACWNPEHKVRPASQDSGEEVDNLLAQLMDTYVFDDNLKRGVLGQITLALGDMHILAGDPEGSTLLRLLSQRDEQPMDQVDKLEYMGLRKAIKRTDRMELSLTSYDGHSDPGLVAELRSSALFMGVAARMGAWMMSISSAVSMEANGGDDANFVGDYDRIGNTAADRRSVSLLSLPDGRRSDLCNTILMAVELLRETWMAGNDKKGFGSFVDELCGSALQKLSFNMPYEAYLEERRAQEWIPIDE